MKRLPSEVSPRMATNALPGLTRRESYSTPLTLGVSALGENLRAIQQMLESHCCRIIGAPQEIKIAIVAMKARGVGARFSQQSRTRLRKVIFRMSAHRSALHYFHEHRNRNRQIPMRAMRTVEECVRVREILLPLPVRNRHPHLCMDGLMYCEPCRTACDYKTSD